MNARIAWLSVVFSALFLSALSGVAQAQAYADVSAQASLGFAVTNSANGALLAQPTDALLGGRFIPDTFIALASAKATVFPDPDNKFVRSYSEIDGADPDMHATSTARVVTQWMVATDGSVVQPGSPVLLDAELSFEGDLVAAGVTFAEATVTMNVYLGGQMTTVFQGGGRNERSVATGGDNVLTPIGDFSDLYGIFSPSSFYAPYGAILGYQRTFDDLFSVNVGDLFEIELILSTHVEAITHSENFALADFYNSGGFSLSLPDGVGGLTLTQIVPVPEPEIHAMLATALCLIGFLVRQRKQIATAA